MPLDTTNYSEAFQMLAIPRCHIMGSETARYRLYTTLQDYQLIAANTATEALKLSGIADCKRIVRERGDSQAIVNIGLMQQSEITPPAAAFNTDYVPDMVIAELIEPPAQ